MPQVRIAWKSESWKCPSPWHSNSSEYRAAPTRVTGCPPRMICAPLSESAMSGVGVGVEVGGSVGAGASVEIGAGTVATASPYNLSRSGGQRNIEHAYEDCHDQEKDRANVDRCWPPLTCLLFHRRPRTTNGVYFL